MGVDPRGIGASENVRCFKSVKDQTAGVRRAERRRSRATKAEEKRVRQAASKAVGKACSTTGKPLTGAMSTAEVARDMDVLRRAVGDKKLTYLGFSYGSALGQYYANMFPDRFRAAGRRRRAQPDRLGRHRARPQTSSRTTGCARADGAYRALHRDPQALRQGRRESTARFAAR